MLNQKLKLGLRFLGLVLTFICVFVQSVESRNKEFGALNNENVFTTSCQEPGGNSTWFDFQTKHILDPTVSQTSGYKDWNRQQWNEFLNKRRPRPISTNTFLVGQTSTILNWFRYGYNMNFKHDGSGISSKPENLYWGGIPFKMYILQRSTPKDDYEVFDCPNMYALAGFDCKTVVPVHFQAQNQSRRTSGNLPLNLNGCNLIGSSASLLIFSKFLWLSIFSGAFLVS